MYSVSRVSFLSSCRTNVFVSGAYCLLDLRLFIKSVSLPYGISVSIELNTPASFIAFIESSLTRKLTSKLKRMFCEVK